MGKYIHSLISHEGLDFGWKVNSQGGVFFSAMSHPRVKCKRCKFVHVQTSQREASQRLAGSGFPKKKKTRFKGLKCTLQLYNLPIFAKPHGLKFVIPPVKGSMEKTPPPRIGEYHGPFLIHRTWGWVAIYFHYYPP